MFSIAFTLTRVPVPLTLASGRDFNLLNETPLLAMKQGLDFELLLMWGLLIGDCTLIAVTPYPLRPIT